MYDFILDGLARFFGELKGYNLFVLFSFPLTAWATYVFLFSQLQDGVASFLGGLLFGFCPAAIIHSLAGHLGFSFNAFLPLFFLAYYYHQKRRSVLSAFGVGGIFSCLTLTCLYWGYFTGITTFFLILWETGKARPQDRIEIALSGLSGLSVGIALVGVFEHRMIYRQLFSTGEALVLQNNIRPLWHLAALSARPWEYFIPSMDHPLIGRFFEGFTRQHLHGSNAVEQQIYMGIVLLCLLGIGYRWLRRERMDESHRRMFLRFFSAAIFVAVLSAPPYVPVGGIKFPTISFFLHKVFPMFRVYSRLGIFVIFFSSCAAAVVAAVFKKKNGKYGFLLPLTAFSLFVFDWGLFPQGKLVPVEPLPQVYQWLSGQNGDFLVAEYPMMPPDEASFYTYVFWQTRHKKKLVNGAWPEDKEAWAFYQKVNDFSKPEIVDLLKAAGVRFIIVHPEKFKEGEIPFSLKRYYPSQTAGNCYNLGRVPVNPLLKSPLQTFSDGVVYEL